MVPHFSVISLPTSSHLHLQKQHQIDISCDQKLLQFFLTHKHNNNFSNSSIISNTDTGNYRTIDHLHPSFHHLPTDSVEMYRDIPEVSPMPYPTAPSNTGGPNASPNQFQNGRRQNWSHTPPPQNWGHSFQPQNRIPLKRPVVLVLKTAPLPPNKKPRPQHNDGLPIDRTAVIPMETCIKRREQLSVFQSFKNGQIEAQKWK
eukprot:UN27961